VEENFEVRVARRRAEALQIVMRHSQPDITLLGLMMLETGGLELQLPTAGVAAGDTADR
jgi:CheY-like chemotaxis protein